MYLQKEKGIWAVYPIADDNPFQKSYNSIPKPLYKKVKEYVQNLLDRGWIRKSVSSYASPVVCV